MTKEFEMIEYTNLPQFNKKVNELLQKGWKIRNEGAFDFTPHDHRDWANYYWATFIRDKGLNQERVRKEN